MKQTPRMLQALLYIALAIGAVFLLQIFFKGINSTGSKENSKKQDRYYKIENKEDIVMNKEFMQRAIELASENIKNGGGPFAALIVKDGKIIAETGNTVTKTNDPTAHAEVNAIREACSKMDTFELKGCQIYSSCEPCPMCMAAIYWARIETVFFAGTRQDAAKAGFDDDFLYKELPLECSERRIPFLNVLAEEGKIPFKEWDKFDKKIPY